MSPHFPAPGAGAKLLGGAGVKSAMYLWRGGVFRDAGTDERARADLLQRRNTGISGHSSPISGIIEGVFQITGLDYAGSHNWRGHV